MTITHPLAHRIGLEIVLRLLLHTGAMCPKCGHGTRVTSKRWAKCKKCGERVARQPMPNVERTTPEPVSQEGKE